MTNKSATLKSGFRLVIVIPLLLCAAPHPALSQEGNEDGFQRIRQEPGVEISERWQPFPGKEPPISSREVKSEFLIKASIYEILHLLRDESQIRVWQKHVSKFKVYLTRDTTYWNEYSYHDIPWPVSDQDHYMEYKVAERVPGSDLFITFKSIVDDKRAPVNNGVTRMQLVGSWRLQQLSPEQMKVTYRIQSVPGSIPRMFTDPVIRNNLITTIRALTALAEQ